MTYVIAEPCIDEILVEGGAPAVAAALAEHRG